MINGTESFLSGLLGSASTSTASSCGERMRGGNQNGHIANRILRFATSLVSCPTSEAELVQQEEKREGLSSARVS